MGDLDAIARWRAERRRVEPPDRLGRIAFWLLIVAGLYLVSRILIGLTMGVPDETPMPIFSRVGLDECQRLAREQMALADVIAVDRRTGRAHPYLHEAERMRLAMRLLECRKEKP